MWSSSEEEESKKNRCGSGDDSCNFCGRTKRTMLPIYSRSISFPSSSARPRPSPFLFRSKSDISPLPPFPSQWTHISSPTTTPNLPTPPAPVPPSYLPPPAAIISPEKGPRSWEKPNKSSVSSPAAAIISPEKGTSPWEKSNKSSVSPPAAAGNASPVADLSPDPSAEKWRRRMVEQPRKVRRKIDTNSPAGDASQEKDGTAGSAEGGEIEMKGETLKFSFSCSCGRTVACDIALI